MTAQEIIDTVHEIDRLLDDEAKAEVTRAVRQQRIAFLRQTIDGLGSEPAKTSQFKSFSKVKKRESPRQDAIRALIVRKPTATYRDVVMELYGEYNKPHVLNARSLISNMKKAAQIVGQPGSWRVVQVPDDARSDNSFALSA